MLEEWIKLWEKIKHFVVMSPAHSNRVGTINFSLSIFAVFTPLGFVRLFGVVGGVLVKPQFLRDLNEEYNVHSCEKQTTQRRINNSLATDNQRKTSPLQRNVAYPLAMLLLLALTTITVLMVLQNTLELLIGIKALPLSTRQFTLGIASLSKLGWAGATLEAFLILYLHAASLTGLATPMSMLRVLPRARQTPLTRIIALCAVLLAHSTAQPLLVKILGITNFDLLGEFGRIEWLGNFKLVLLYNAIFAATVTFCLVSEFTASVRRELYNRFKWLTDVFVMQENLHLSKIVSPIARLSTERTVTAEKTDPNHDKIKKNI
ncbi:jg2180 [Pararge aegeria aegeria]|uniref:Jg2180 protein n=1 Tax=Pararge aegeria aegeria TaxID=348720 RepID=A0A8S4RZX1_9NEOP|nr:jg2180 [Pararge aegeria aegeria]